MTTILIGIPCLLVGGTEIQTLRLVEALVSGGYRVVTVCYFEYNAQMVNNYKIAGSEVVCLSAYSHRPEGKTMWKFLYRGLQRVVNDYHPDIAHVQYMAPGALPILMLRWLGVKTIIATTHTTADIYKNLRLVHFIANHITKVFTCVSQTAEKSFFGTANLYNEAMTLQAHNHITLYNGIKLDHYSHSDARTLSEHPVIGVVARLEKIKGADLILPAFAQVLSNHPQVRLMIVGDGSLREMMEQQQASLGIAPDKVIWKGRVSASTLPSLYKQMDIVWCPSRSEGFGLSAVEAMASGTVVVASIIGGLSEIVKSEEHPAGLLFCTESTEDLADKSSQLLENPDLYAQLSQMGYNRSRDFGFEQYKANVLSLYQKL